MLNRLISVLVLSISLISISSWACEICGKTECKNSSLSTSAPSSSVSSTSASTNNSAGVAGVRPPSKKQKGALKVLASGSKRTIVLNHTSLLRLIASFLSDHDLSQMRVSRSTREAAEYAWEDHRKQLIRQLIWPDLTDHWSEAKNWKHSQRYAFLKDFIRGFQVFDRVSKSRWSLVPVLHPPGASPRNKEMVEVLAQLQLRTHQGSFADLFLQGAQSFLAGRVEQSNAAFKQAFNTLRELATQGSQSAQDLLALCLQNRWGTPPNLEEEKRYPSLGGPQNPLSGDQFSRKKKYLEIVNTSTGARNLHINYYTDTKTLNEILDTGYSSRAELTEILEIMMGRKDVAAVSRAVQLLLDDPTLRPSELRHLRTRTFDYPRHSLAFADAVLKTGAGTVDDKTQKAKLLAELGENKKVHELWKQVRDDPKVNLHVFTQVFRNISDFETSAILYEKLIQANSPPKVGLLAQAAVNYIYLSGQKAWIHPRTDPLIAQVLSHRFEAGEARYESMYLRMIGKALYGHKFFSRAITVLEKFVKDSQCELEDKFALIVSYAHLNSPPEVYRSLLEDALYDPSLTPKVLEAKLQELGPNSAELKAVFENRRVELKGVP